ncbi:MAG: hypothetical protein JF888_02440 [Candidatus Dormibacteraeota bacterium]|uniref:Uncharacterized protein n=1 Tax=Candidatus Dormiibacter inghamiae TaxID=3127013 RepID=A0A934NB30_9BACT|nr:hypothetical protein [Candidatus Dormibacteraeota bacterium]
MFSVLTITTLAIGYFVLAWRFANELRWRFWVLPAVITGLLTIVFIAAFGAMLGHRPAGLFERLSSGVGSVLILLVLARLLTQSLGAAENAAAFGPRR